MIRVAFLLICVLLHSSVRADIYIIAHKDLMADSLSSQDIAAIYLLKKKYWDNEASITPINLPARSEIRDLFTQKIFNRSPDKLGNYWNQMLYKGISPPIIQKSEASILLFVERVPGSIGYISRKPDNPNVKILFRIQD